MTPEAGLDMDLPAQYYALGDFTINALPEGYVQPKANGKYEICVNKVYFFINDSFNFEGNEPLGIWYLDYDPAISTLLSPFIEVNNSDFKDFQRYGYGRNFPVLSKLHELEDFVPVCIEY